MTRPIHPFALVVPLLLASCASVPARQVSVTGTLPSAGRIALVQPDADLPALSAVASCLTAAGYTRAQPAATLVQVAYAVRPARAQVLRGADAAPARGHQPGAGRDQAALTLVFTDPASGALLWRGAVTQRLRKGEAAGDGTSLAEPLCTAVRDGRAAGSR